MDKKEIIKELTKLMVDDLNTLTKSQLKFILDNEKGGLNWKNLVKRWRMGSLSLITMGIRSP